FHVTGVQTCALPISDPCPAGLRAAHGYGPGAAAAGRRLPAPAAGRTAAADRRRHRHGADVQPDRTLPGERLRASRAPVLGGALPRRLLPPAAVGRMGTYP